MLPAISGPLFCWPAKAIHLPSGETLGIPVYTLAGSVIVVRIPASTSPERAIFDHGCSPVFESILIQKRHGLGLRRAPCTAAPSPPVGGRGSGLPYLLSQRVGRPPELCILLNDELECAIGAPNTFRELASPVARDPPSPTFRRSARR